MDLRKVQNLIAALLILLALVGALFRDQIDEWWKNRTLRNTKGPAIGQIEALTGSVHVRLPQSLATVLAKPGMTLHAEESLVTEDQQSAVVALHSGLKVQIEPNSTVVLTDSGSELVFIRGHVKILNEVPGVQLPPEAITRGSPEKPVVSEKVLPKEEPAEIRFKSKKADEKRSLPDSYISSVIKNQKTFLGRCYAQHLSHDPDAQGRIETSLIIDSDGTVSSARVIGSTIPDPQLQQCIVGTLQRAKFRSFAGDPIVVNYPINFD